jgi:heme-degrading monooxygenase HmoA
MEEDLKNYLTMIQRLWKGLAKVEEADSYIHHLQSETFPELATMKGYIASSILIRPVNNGIEFLVITSWESIEAIRQFANGDVENAVVPPVVRNMMITYDEKATHYQAVV